MLNCAKLMFVSYTSNLLEQMCDFRKCTMFLQKWILNPQYLPRKQSLETIPICIVSQYYPHSNIVCIYMWDKCKILIDSSVCQSFWPIFLTIVQICSLTIKYNVVQFLPSTSISEQFESIHVTILQQISFLLHWSGGRVAGSSCLPAHNIAPHISSHDPPYLKTMKKYEGLREKDGWQIISWPKAPTEDDTEFDAQIALNCLTRLRRGLDMHHWHCHASNRRQTTNNKLLWSLQRTPLVPYTAHGAQRAHSNRDEIQPIYRCTVPSICPQTNATFQQNVLSRGYRRKPNFGTRDWSTFCDTCFVRRSAAFAELATFCKVTRPSAIHCCKARSCTCTCFMLPRPWRVAVPMAAVLSQRSRTVVGKPMSIRSSRRPNDSAAPTLIAWNSDSTLDVAIAFCVRDQEENWRHQTREDHLWCCVCQTGLPNLHQCTPLSWVICCVLRGGCSICSAVPLM